MKKIVLFSLSLSVILACGTKKNAANALVASKADYAYITKFHEGIRLKTKGQTDEAIATFEQCLSFRNSDAPAYALYELYTLKNNKEKAGVNLQKAYKLDPKNIHYVTELAYYFYETGNFDKSVEYFKSMVKLQPRNPDFQYGLAEALVQAGKPTEAIDALNKTQDQVGNVPELAVQKFKLYMQLKKPELGLKELELGLKENPGDGLLLSTMVEYYYQQKKEDKAIETLERMAEADPSNGRVHIYLAEVYRSKGNRDKYFSSLKKAIAGEGIDLDQKTKAVISVQEQKLSNDPRAMQLALALVEQYPTEGKPYTVLGDFYIERNQDDSALIAYAKAIEYVKNAYPIWQQVMIMQYQNRAFEALYSTSTECLEYFPTQATVFLLHGVACNQLKKYSEAKKALETGVEYVANDPSLKAEIYGQLGDSYFLTKDIAEGKLYYEKALNLDPKSFLLLNNYAYRLALAKIDLDNASALIKRAVDANPNQSHFMDTYGWVFFQKGDFKSAAEWYKKAYDISQEDKIIVEHMGDAAIKLGNTAEALDYWKKAKALGSINATLDKKIEKAQYYDPIY